MKVFRYSDGSYLEGQDYWKYSGIERDVYLYARPQSRVRDFRMTAELVNDYKDGELDLDILLHQPKVGESVEVKVLDEGRRFTTGRSPSLSPLILCSANRKFSRIYVHGMRKRRILTH